MFRIRQLALVVLLPAWLSLPAQSNSVPPPTPAAQFEQARELIRRGHAQDAIKMLDTLRATNPKLPGLESARGDAFYSIDHLQEADNAYELAVADNPQDLEAMQMRGLTLFRLGRPADAIPLLEKAPGKDVQAKADPSYVLALCYMDTGRPDDARHAFAAQYGFPADSAAAYLLAARMLFRREYVPVAKRFASTSLSLEPQLPLANELLGEIALAENKFDEAAGYFEKEKARNPLEPSSYERLGDAYIRASRYPEARLVLQQAILLEPNATGPYILLGKVTLKEGDATAASTFLEKAVRMDPANAMSHNLLAQAYRDMGRTDDVKREMLIVQKLHQADQPKLLPPQ